MSGVPSNEFRSDPRERPTYRWKVVAMLWFVCFLSYADRQAIFSVFPSLKAQFGFSSVQLGLIGSAFMWVYALGAPFAGIIADRLSRKRIIIAACVFWSGATAMTAWCGTFWQFFFVRALSGGGETLYYPAALSLVSDYHDKGTRSKAFSFHQSGVYIGTIGGSWAGAWFAQRGQWQVAFLFFGAAGIAVACLLGRFLREPAREQRPAGAGSSRAELVRGYGALFRNPTACLLMAAFLLANAVASVFLIWTPTFLVEKFGFKIGAAGLSGAVFIHLASALSVPFAGIAADRLARRFAGGRIIVQASGLLVGAAFVALVGLTRDITTLLVAMTLFGLCKGFYDSNIFASLYDVVEPRFRGSAAGMMNLVGWGGGAMGPLAVGWVAQHGPHALESDNMSLAIAWGSVVYLLGCGLLVLAAMRFAPKDVRVSRVAIS